MAGRGTAEETAKPATGRPEPPRLVLEPTMPYVLARLQRLKARLENVGQVLRAIEGTQVCSTSPLGSMSTVTTD